MTDKSDAPNEPRPTLQPQAPFKTTNAAESLPKATHKHTGSVPNAPSDAKPAPGANQSSANRQNYTGNPNGRHYNKHRNFNQKANNHNNQYSAAGYSYPPNMYGTFYYPYPYPQGMVPNMNSMPKYSLQLAQHASMPQYSATTSPVPAKVKITDKDGKQVDLEEKKKAFTSPVPTTAPVATTPPTSVADSSRSSQSATPSPASAAASPSASIDSASTPGKLTPAEEFRRKILEKAQKAKLKKAQELGQADKATPVAKTVEEKEIAKPVEPVETEQPKHVTEDPKSQPEPVKEEVVATEAPVEQTEPVKPVEESKPQSAEHSETVNEEDIVEPAKNVEQTEPVEEVEQAEPVKEVEPVKPVEPVEPSEPVEAKESAKTVEPVEPIAKADALKEVEPIEPVEKEAQHEDTDSKTQEGEEENEDDESEEPEVVFDLSLYFARLEDASAIEDPFTFSYPYPLAGVDPRWKAGEKKYRYDPQFLLQFREVVQYPIDDTWKEKLESLGIVPVKRQGSSQRMNSNKFGNQMQGRFGSSSGRPGQFDGRQNSRSGSKRRGGSNAGGPRDKSVRNRNQSKRGKESKEREEEAKPVEEVAPLVPTANRWVPRSRAKPEEVKLAPDGSVLLDKEGIERKTQSSLNKLTLEMFEPITEELLAIARQSRWEDDAKTIKQVISLTFAKACDEPYWSTVYAQFCAKMLKLVDDDIKDVNILTKTGEPATGGDLARRILLATCQSEYEKGWVDKLPTNEDGSPLEPEMMSAEYYEMAAAKRRGLGLVKFIGNLYILNMLNDQVILHCLRDQSKNVVDPSEDALENLAQLIKTVGPRFETSDRNKAALNMIYDNIQQILDNCKISSRIRFMLMDLQDLRKANWKSLKSESGPKTIKEIHNEAELKRIEEGRAQAEKRRQNKPGFNSGNNYNGGDSRSNSARGGSSWGNRKEPRQATKDSRGFQSVPRSQSNRPAQESSAPASTMSPRENSKRTDSMASNIFAALDDEDAGH